MLTDYPSYATIPASDMQRARAFYEDTLGLTPESEQPSGVFYRSGSTRFLLFPSSGTASGAHTQMGWHVDDIAAEVAALKERGVRFETYDFEGFDSATSVATMGSVKGAWFQDTEGNLLGIAQFLTS